MRRSACSPLSKRTLALVSPFAVTSFTPRHRREPLDHRRHFRRRDDKIQIADRLHAAPQTASGFGALTCGKLRSPATIGAGDSHASHHRWRASVGFAVLDAGENFLLRLFAKPSSAATVPSGTPSPAPRYSSCRACHAARGFSSGRARGSAPSQRARARPTPSVFRKTPSFPVCAAP